jgi:hypothetical protein
MVMVIKMVIHLKLFKLTKSIYYYESKRKSNKWFGGFGIGHFGHRYIKIGKYDIVLWQVKELQKKKTSKPIHEQINELVQTGSLEIKE